MYMYRELRRTICICLTEIFFRISLLSFLLHFCVNNFKLENSIKAKARHESYTYYYYINMRNKTKQKYKFCVCLIPICL